MTSNDELLAISYIYTPISSVGCIVNQTNVIVLLSVLSSDVPLFQLVAGLSARLNAETRRRMPLRDAPYKSRNIPCPNSTITTATASIIYILSVSVCFLNVIHVVGIRRSYTR